MHRWLPLQVLIALLLFGVAFALFSNHWIQRSEASRTYHSLEEIPARKVAIVLGARVYPDGTVSVALQDRLEAALRLYRAGKVQQILVSGDHSRPDYDEVNTMQHWLVSRGVPVEDVYLDHAGLRTFDTMVRASQIFGVKEAIITTQEFHLHRSLFLARSAGIDAVGLAADQRHYPRARFDHRRERIARTIAMVDHLNPIAKPRHLGPPIPIDSSPAGKTHDPNSLRGALSK